MNHLKMMDVCVIMVSLAQEKKHYHSLISQTEVHHHISSVCTDTSIINTAFTTHTLSLYLCFSLSLALPLALFIAVSLSLSINDSSYQNEQISQEMR